MSFQRKTHRLWVKLASKIKRIHAFATHKDPVDALLQEVRSAQPEPQFENSVIVITGSSNGIGLVVAKAFLQKGARVVINGRNTDRLQQALQTLEPASHTLAVCADVSTPQGAATLLEQTLARFGTVTVLINNAAVMGPKDHPAWTLSESQWRTTLQSNLDGPFYCASTFMKWMQQQGQSGRIINISSGAANAPVKGLLPYALSKTALDALTTGLAADAAGTGIAVAGLQLGSTKTDMARSFFPWEEYELLPPPETLVPAFWHMVSASPGSIHGRTIAAWRYLMAREAEPMIAKPMSVVERFRFSEQVVPEHIPLAERIVLNRAENQFGPPDSVRSMTGYANGLDISKYPDPNYSDLRHTLATKLGLEDAALTFGNGSAELVERVLRVFTKPGESVISHEPSWFMFDRFAYVQGVRNDKVPFVPHPSEGFDHNLDGILAAITHDTRLIYLINPSNPVGVPILHAAFKAFLAKVPRHIPVIVDEAYVDFADRPDVLNMAAMVRESDHPLFSLRTFSKFYGLAGLRVGYAFAKPVYTEWLDRGEMLFNISSLAAEVARTALLDEAHAQRTANNCSTERTRIMQFLTEKQLAFVPTQSNMMLFEPPCEAERFFDKLQAVGIVPARGVVLGRYVLWPVALPHQNDRIMQMIETLA